VTARSCQVAGGPHIDAEIPQVHSAAMNQNKLASCQLARIPFLGAFYQSDRPSKNALEKKWIESSREKVGNASDLELLQKTFESVTG